MLFVQRFGFIISFTVLLCCAVECNYNFTMYIVFSFISRLIDRVTDIVMYMYNNKKKGRIEKHLATDWFVIRFLVYKENCFKWLNKKCTKRLRYVSVLDNIFIARAVVRNILYMFSTRLRTYRVGGIIVIK